MIAGHMHDGGANVEFTLNQKVICDSQAIYGGKPTAEDADMAAAGAGSGMAGMGGMNRMALSPEGSQGMGASGITAMTVCSDKPVQLKKGDKLSVKANFDTIKHPM
jgi:hypothetical protein